MNPHIEVLRKVDSLLARVRPNSHAAAWVVDELKQVQAALAAMAAQPEGCHCATCGCNPGMTPAVRFDASPAEREGAVRDHLIRTGWTPPGAQPEAQNPAEVLRDIAEVIAEDNGLEVDHASFDAAAVVVAMPEAQAEGQAGGCGASVAVANSGAYLFSAAPHTPMSIAIHSHNHQPMITIRQTGEVELAPGLEIGEASRLFWSAVADAFPAWKASLLAAPGPKENDNA